MLFQNTSLGAKIVAGALLALALFVGGFVTAQATQKPIVEEKIVEKIVEVEKLQLVEKIRVIIVKDTESKKSTDRTWKTTTTPDGTVTTEATEKTKEEIKEKEKVVVTEDRIVEVEKIVYTDRVVEKTVDSLPDWRVGLQGGLEFGRLDLMQPVVSQPWVLGVTGERRLIGSLYGGVWGNSAGAGGITLSLGF